MGEEASAWCLFFHFCRNNTVPCEQAIEQCDFLFSFLSLSLLDLSSPLKRVLKQWFKWMMGCLVAINTSHCDTCRCLLDVLVVVVHIDYVNTKFIFSTLCLVRGRDLTCGSFCGKAT